MLHHNDISKSDIASAVISCTKSFVHKKELSHKNSTYNNFIVMNENDIFMHENGDFAPQNSWNIYLAPDIFMGI